MDSSSLYCLFFPDVPEWERAPIHALLDALHIRQEVRWGQVSEGGDLPAEAFGADALWVISRDWKRALGRAKRLRAGRYYVSILGAAITSPSLPLLVLRRFRPLISESVHILTHSHLNFRFFREIEGLDEGRLSFLHLPQGTGLPPRGPAGERPFTVGTLGPLQQESNLNYFLNVAHYVHQRSPEVRFRILGNGRLERHLRRMLGDLDLGGVVELSANETSEQIGNLDVMVYCPLRNHHFVPVQTAGMFGIPVLASEIPGVSEFVRDSRDGFVLPVNETRPMGELILRLHRDPGMGRAIGEQLRQSLSERFSGGALVNSYQTLFRGTQAVRQPVIQAA